MAIEITGNIINIFPVVTGEGKNGPWKKQEFLIETTEQYPKKALFSIMGEKISMLSSYSVGQSVKVSFNVDSREYNGKYYTNLTAWKIDAAGASNNAGTSNSNAYAAPNYNQNNMTAASPMEEYSSTAPIKDDLPF